MNRRDSIHRDIDFPFVPSTTDMAGKTVAIIGGVAGGASAAARLRRNDENVTINMYERGQYVSFANCGLPYYVGGIIKEQSDLFLTNPEELKRNYNINVFINTEVLSFDKNEKTLRVIGPDGERADTYDRLILSPGAQPIIPPFPGRDLPGIFTIRAVPDTELVRSWLKNTPDAKTATIVGGGFIGLEMAENLHTLGFKVTIIDMADQVMTPMDKEMAIYAEQVLERADIDLVLGDGVAGFEPADGKTLLVRTAHGRAVDADIVILAIGVRPDNKLAVDAGLAVAKSGCIAVDDHQTTSDANVYAVGDVAEKYNVITKTRMPFYMAGPANRQGRVAADAICGRENRFRGIQGTGVCGIMGLQVAMTGLTEKAMVAAGKVKGKDFDAVYLHPLDHVEYYPSSHHIHMKIVFSVREGKLLGAQAVGVQGAERRIDVLSMALQMGATVYDLAESELCYSPQYGAAKDAVNLAGFYAINTIKGYAHNSYWNPNNPSVFPDDAVLIDVRERDEVKESGTVPGATNIPMSEIRTRLDELSKDKTIHVFCLTGVRGHSVMRMLVQNGFSAKNISGGYTSYLSCVPKAHSRKALASVLSISNLNY
ncbi:hypothetical protein SARC_12586 [Sphaeroforma arctica JP610]|uniref:Rhodanese domain-containing protein n=1 Tax=Sphaeroforma arctica JP610 TaxID=667725 RepID=A0A0L0FFP0_9EUKA|nr:hypothetical protein SARC_12586 [Sphaeroforma arctica JP610]KNC74878.1 hypothetical protein SARC_12586 [Sphaeroforma arctica JP610]|eukprot:XP_014148780.1 hypothetical protein SARC_12586 [Sphaeroforma arctica JP610]